MSGCSNEPVITGNKLKEACEMNISKQTLSWIAQWEGCEQKRPDGLIEAYLCPAGHWTIGYGMTSIYNRPVQKGDVITQAQADRLFLETVTYFQKEVLQMVQVPLNSNQLTALVSFAYNVGLDIDADTLPEVLGDSTLLKKLNQSDYAGAAAEFEKWVWAKGKKLEGLKRRRKAERFLFGTAI
jgi:lysozyme